MTTAMNNATSAPRDERRAFAVWITGLPASGKSTIASALAAKLKERGIRFAVLESDALRKLLPASPTYDQQDRQYFYSSLVFIGEVLTRHGVSVIFDATANRRAYRDRARERIRPFVEVFVDCPLDICTQRDPKGIYRMAREGKAAHVPGVQAPYEPPEKPDLVVRGNRDRPEDVADRILKLLAGTIDTPAGGWYESPDCI